jgi:hypothetical protein
MTYRSIFRDAKPVNMREAQAGLSKLAKSSKPSLIISHGKPLSFIIPYDEMLEVLDMVEELRDVRLIKGIALARSEYENGNEVGAEGLFRRLGL